jgi:hypothetical protein
MTTCNTCSLHYTVTAQNRRNLTLSLTGGGPIGPPLFKRPVAQKVIKLKKFGKISYSTEIILALKLSSGVSSEKAVLYK